MEYLPILLGAALVCLLVVSAVFRFGRRTPLLAQVIVALLIVTLSVFRIFGIVTDFGIFLIYGSIVTLNYAITYYRAFFIYVDPAENELSLIEKKIKVQYVVAVYNEQGFITRCIQSIIQASEYVSNIAEVEIVIVNDASTDDTLDRLLQINHPFVKVISLNKNQGKKGALTAGMCGGENWRDGYDLFYQKYHCQPQIRDYHNLIACLQQVGCDASHQDLVLHTDSDSVISEGFIYHQIVALLSDPQIGAISGHCDVWIDEDIPPTFFEKLQVAWYMGQFAIRKAAESPKVYCVSGPGAGLRPEAIFPYLREWVDDYFGGKIYKGATDRRLTLFVLEDGWKVVYSQKAQSWTMVPPNYSAARKQWTRWKQNFFRMFVPVWQHAYKEPLWSAYLTYSRLMVTVLAPFIVTYHLILAVLGEYQTGFLYVLGISAIGSIMAIATAAKYEGPHKSYLVYRPVMSLVSSLWGSILTLRAFFLTIQNSFVWRDERKASFPFEVQYLLGVTALVVMIVVLKLVF